MPDSLPRSSLTAGLLLLSAILLPAGDFTPTPIIGMGRTEGGKMSFTIPSDPGSYHILRRSLMPHLAASGRPVTIIRGAEQEVTINDSVLPKGRGFYQIETRSNTLPSDVDGDGLTDYVELGGRLVVNNPINPAPAIQLEHGSVMLKTRDQFETLSVRDDRPGAASVREVKFLVFNIHTDSPELYFSDSNRYPYHHSFTAGAVQRYVGDLGGFNNDTYNNNSTRKNLAGSLVSHDNYVDANGRAGLYTVEFWPTDAVAFRFVQTAYELIAASMPYVDGNIAYYPSSETQRQLLRTEEEELANSHVRVIHTEDLFANVVYSGLNTAESYGRLRLITGSETLSVRDIAIFRNIPNDLTHVAGIMTEIPQTPLSHINLKAKQNNTPNAYIKDASQHPDIAPLLGQNVYYKVGPDGFEIRAATQEEVDTWFEAIRPTETQYPARDLSITEITPLADVRFEDADVFGAKASNLAELKRILPDNTPANGYAVPFYFYDEFMKYNGFYGLAAAMMADPEFQSVPEIRESRLKDFRRTIKDGFLPLWMSDALDAMHQAVGGTPRARSSTNNEDLEGFNGAGLYSSYTHHTDEGHFQKSAKQVWASLWNYRAYEEREFWRIDHFTAAMGILVHGNFSNERANGVGVTTNIFDPRWNGHYVNVQVGESLVTNPDADAIPEEYLIARLASPTGEDEIQYIRFSNLVPEGETVLTREQAVDLKAKMTTLHNHFKSKYGASGNTWAMEVEFKIAVRGQLVIKQARPWLN